MDIFTEFHPLTRGGLIFILVGIVFFIAAFRGIDIGQVVKVSGRTSQSVRWQNRVFKLIAGCTGLGVCLSILGFYLPAWEKAEGKGLSERAWHGSWSIEFMGEGAPANIDNVDFDHIAAEGGLLQGRIFDAEGGECASFTRLKPSAGQSDDFRVVKGSFQLRRGGKSLITELALHGDRETFSGFVYASKSSNRITCWGKKR